MTAESREARRQQEALELVAVAAALAAAGKDAWLIVEMLRRSFVDVDSDGFMGRHRPGCEAVPFGEWCNRRCSAPGAAIGVLDAIDKARQVGSL